MPLIYMNYFELAHKYYHFTLVRYSVGTALFFIAGVALGMFIAQRKKPAGVAIIIVSTLISLYAYTLVHPILDVFGRSLNRVQTGERLVALTFDDGPSVKYTTPILDLLKQNGAHATFFVLGVNAERNPNLIRRMIRDGNTVGNHTYHHCFLFSKSAGFRKNEIMGTHNLIKSIAGIGMKYYRSPYEYRDFRLLGLLKKLNYTYIGHNIGTHDVTGSTPEQIASNIMKGLHPGAIVLLHDDRGNRERTVRALEIVLPKLGAKGYRAVSIDELVGYK
jgi:peptidoglycan-N-acetylglucosamine deacetylase